MTPRSRSFAVLICSSSTSTTTSALRLVVGLDDALRHLHLVGGVAQDDRVELLVGGDLPGVDQAAQDGHHVLDLGVREEEGLDDQVLVGAPVLRRVGGDDDRCARRPPCRSGRRRASGSRARPGRSTSLSSIAISWSLQVGIEQDVDAERLAERAVDVADRHRLGEVERDRLVRARVEHRRLRRRAAGLLLHLLDGASASRSCALRRVERLRAPSRARRRRTGWWGRAATACWSSTSARSSDAGLAGTAWPSRSGPARP